MTRSPAGRSGRPSRAAGPLVTAGVAVALTVGLGCAAVAEPAAGLSTGASARSVVPTGETDRPAAGPAGTGWDPAAQLRPPTDTPGSSGTATDTAPEPGGDREQPTDGAALVPEVPVVDATAPPPATVRAGERPTRIRIGAIDLDVEVVATGVAKDGTMELPDTVENAGWYRFSPTPGAGRGSTVIASHVDTKAEGLGPFGALASVRDGSRIVVTDRDGTDHRYAVTRVRSIPRTRLPVEDLFTRDGPARLVLVTCGGAYDSRYGYHDNVVVLAEPDP